MTSEVMLKVPVVTVTRLAEALGAMRDGKGDMLSVVQAADAVIAALVPA